MERKLQDQVLKADHCQVDVLKKKERNLTLKDRFEKGEFRKRIQFMQGGKLEKIKFKYKGNYLEAILDRLPIIAQEVVV